MTKIVLIAAVAANRVIGKDGALPWHIPEELAVFKALTMGHSIGFGIKTWAQFKANSLPGRDIHLLNTESPWGGGKREIYRQSINLGDIEGSPDDFFFIGGGAKTYELYLPYCDELIISWIHKEYDGDTFFPDFNEDNWLIEEIYSTDEFNTFHYTKHSTWAKDKLKGLK